MKRLEKRVERELVDILYSITISNPSPITKFGDGLEILFSEVMNPEYSSPLYIILIVNKSMPLLRTTLLIDLYEEEYTIQSLQFMRGQRLLEKRKLVKYLKRI